MRPDGPKPSLHSASNPSRERPKVVPDLTRAVATVVSGSSPNVYKTSPFSYLDFLVYFSRPLDFNWRDKVAPSQIHLL